MTLLGVLHRQMTPSDWQPTLSGSLVRLRPLAADDFEALHAAASDPLIWEQHPEPTRWRRDVFEGFFAKALDSRGALLASDAVSGAILGTSRFYDPRPAQISVGYTFLARSVWGQGHNREMKALMLGYAFERVEAVVFDIGARNLRSRRAIEKIGAEFLGALNPAIPDHVTYRVRRP